MTATTRNRYLEHLHLDPPDIEELMKPRQGQGRPPQRPRPLELLTCAILEAGRPLAWEEAAERLGRAGLTAKKGRLDKLLRSSCKGRRPVVKGPGETVDLDLYAIELEDVIQRLGLRPSPPTLQLVDGPDQNDHEDVASDEEAPLSEEELRLAFGDGDLSGFNGARQAAALLDAMGVERMPATDVERSLDALTQARASLSETTPQAWAAAPTSLGEDGIVTLDRDHRGLRSVRRMVRTWALAAGDLEREEEEAEEMTKAFLENALHEWEVDHEIYLAKKRSVLHVVPAPDCPEAAALLEFPQGAGEERVRVFLPGELEALGAALSEQGVVAGIDPRASFHALELDPHRPLLIELAPKSWTPRVEPGQRVSRFTQKSLIQAAIGHEPLAPGAMKALLRADGDREALAARLRLDAWALATFYRFGVLHGGLPVYQASLPVFAECGWTLPGEPRMPALLQAASREGLELEFRDRHSWRLPSPWSRSRPGRLVGFDVGRLILEGRRGRFEIDPESIGDVRSAQSS